MTNETTLPVQVGSNDGFGPNAEDADPPPPRITDAPGEIWLNYGDLEHDDTHWECCRSGEVTWCEDKQFDSDVAYVRAEKADELRALADSEGTRAVEYLRRARKAEAALRELMACHTEAEGWSASMMVDRAAFDEMLTRSQERLGKAVLAARLALGA